MPGIALTISSIAITMSSIALTMSRIGLALFTEITLRKGAYFIKEGEFAKQIGFLTNGVIRAFYRNSIEEEYNKHFFTTNNLFAGYSSLNYRRT
jgi:hypothetical protein